MQVVKTGAVLRSLKPAWCCSVLFGLVALQHAAFAQEAPHAICVAAAGADTGYVHAIGTVPGGGVLIGARQGLFLARETAGKIGVSPAGDADTGRVLAIQTFAGGALVGASNGLFVARETNGTIAVAPAGDADTGPVRVMHDLASVGVLVGSENGLFLAREAERKVTVAPAGDARIGRVYHMMEWPGGGVLVADARDGFSRARRAARSRSTPRARSTPGPCLRCTISDPARS